MAIFIKDLEAIEVINKRNLTKLEVDSDIIHFINYQNTDDDLSDLKFELDTNFRMSFDKNRSYFRSGLKNWSQITQVKNLFNKFNNTHQIVFDNLEKVLLAIDAEEKVLFERYTRINSVGGYTKSSFVQKPKKIVFDLLSNFLQKAEYIWYNEVIFNSSHKLFNSFIAQNSIKQTREIRKIDFYQSFKDNSVNFLKNFLGFNFLNVVKEDNSNLTLIENRKLPYSLLSLSTATENVLNYSFDHMTTNSLFFGFYEDEEFQKKFNFSSLTDNIFVERDITKELMPIKYVNNYSIITKTNINNLITQINSVGINPTIISQRNSNEKIDSTIFEKATNVNIFKIKTQESEGIGTRYISKMIPENDKKLESNKPESENRFLSKIILEELWGTRASNSNYVTTAPIVATYEYREENFDAKKQTYLDENYNNNQSYRREWTEGEDVFNRQIAEENAAAENQYTHEVKISNYSADERSFSNDYAKTEMILRTHSYKTKQSTLQAINLIASSLHSKNVKLMHGNPGKEIRSSDGTSTTLDTSNETIKYYDLNDQNSTGIFNFDLPYMVGSKSHETISSILRNRLICNNVSKKYKKLLINTNADVTQVTSANKLRFLLKTDIVSIDIISFQNNSSFQNVSSFQNDLTFIDGIKRKIDSNISDIANLFQNENHLKNIFYPSDSLSDISQRNSLRKIDEVELNQEFLCRNKKIFGESNLPDYLEFKHNIINLNKDFFEDKVLTSSSIKVEDIDQIQIENNGDFNNLKNFVDEYYESRNLPREFKTTAGFFESITELCKKYISELSEISDRANGSDIYQQQQLKADLLQSATIFKLFLDNYYNSNNNENSFNNSFLDLLMSDMIYTKYSNSSHKVFRDSKYQTLFKSNDSPIYKQENITAVAPFHIYFTNEDQKVKITNGSVRRSSSTKNAELLATNGRDENYNSLRNINIYETNGLFTHFILTEFPVETQSLFSFILPDNSLSTSIGSERLPLAGYNILENYQQDGTLYSRYVLFVPTLKALYSKDGYEINVRVNYKKDNERSNTYLLNNYFLADAKFKYSTSRVYDSFQNTGLLATDKSKDIFYKIMSLFSSLLPRTINQANNNDLNYVLNIEFFREIKQMLNDTILLAGEIYLNMFYKMQGFESVCKRINMSNTANLRSPYYEYKPNFQGFPSSEAYRKEMYSFFFHNLRRKSAIGDKRLIINGKTSDIITGLQNTPWNRGSDIQEGEADNAPSWLTWKKNFTNDDKFADIYLYKTLYDSSLCIKDANEREKHTDNINFERLIKRVNSFDEEFEADASSGYLSLDRLGYIVPSNNISVRKMLYLFNEILFDMNTNNNSRKVVIILKHLLSQNIPLKDTNSDGTKSYNFSTYHLHFGKLLSTPDFGGKEENLNKFLTSGINISDPNDFTDLFDANINIFEQFKLYTTTVNSTSKSFYILGSTTPTLVFYNYSSLCGFNINNETSAYNIFNVNNDGDQAKITLKNRNERFKISDNTTLKFLSTTDICNSLIFNSYIFENKEYSIDRLESDANIRADVNEKSYGINTLKMGFDSNLGLKELLANDTSDSYISDGAKYSRFADINESWFNHIIQGLLVNDLSLMLSFDFLLYYKKGFFSDLKNNVNQILQAQSHFNTSLDPYLTTLKNITLNKTESNKLQKLFLTNKQNNKLQDLYLQSLVKYKSTQNIVDIIASNQTGNRANLNNVIEKIIKQRDNDSDYTDNTELFFNYFDDAFIRQLHLNKDSINNIHNIPRTNVPVMTFTEKLNGSHIITVGIKNSDKTDRDDIFSISVQLIDHDFPDIIWEPKVFEFHSAFESPDNFVLKYLSNVNSALKSPLSDFNILDNHSIPLKIFRNITSSTQNDNNNDKSISFKDALIRKKATTDLYPNLRNNINSNTYQPTPIEGQYNSIINPISIENDTDKIIANNLFVTTQKILKQFNAFNQMGNFSNSSIVSITNLATDLLKRCIHNQKTSFRLQKMIKLITGFEPTIDFSSSLSDEQRSILNGKYILKEVYDIYIGSTNSQIIYGFSRKEIDLLIDRTSSLSFQIPGNLVVLFKVLTSEKHALNVFLKYLSDFSKALMLENRLLFGNLNTFEKIVNVAVNPKDFIVAGFSGSGARDFVPTSPELTFRAITADTGIYLDEIGTEPNKILRFLTDFTEDREKIEYYHVYKDGIRYIPKNVSYRISTTILK